MNRDDDQELWDLLGRSEPPTLSPFFARNVVRQVRQSPDGWPDRAVRWLTARRAIPAAAMALLVCGAVTFGILHQRPSDADDDVPAVVAQIDPSDYEIVADLDDLLASQEDDSWDDTPTL
jgi:hypothetical protein